MPWKSTGRDNLIGLGGICGGPAFLDSEGSFGAECFGSNFGLSLFS